MKILELDEAKWNEWVSARPKNVQKLCRQFPPDRLYRLKPAGHRVTIFSYSENGTISVLVSGDYNAVLFERRVFGIDPNDIEECDTPSPTERLGVVLKDEKVIQMVCNELCKLNQLKTP